MIEKKFDTLFEATEEKFSGICFLSHMDERIWMKNGLWHNVNGPAYKNEKRVSYWINDKPISEQDFWSHYLVVKHKLDLILELCL